MPIYNPLPIKQYAIFAEQYSSGTAGPTASATTWNVRHLNTSVTNTITGCSLSSNQITLPAGTYDIKGYGIATIGALAVSNNCQLALYDVGNNVYLAVGLSMGGLASGGPTSMNDATSFIESIIVLTSTLTIELVMYTSAACGLGIGVSTGQVECYSQIKIVKM